MNEETPDKEAGVTSISISPVIPCTCIAAGALDEVIRIWDARTGQFL